MKYMANVAEPLFIHLTISIFQYFNCSIFQSFISMKRRDLAKMYFPDMSDVEAVRSLRRWIEGCPQLMSALDELSMPYKKCRILSARQVRIIMEYLGDPWVHKSTESWWPYNRVSLYHNDRVFLCPNDRVFLYHKDRVFLWPNDRVFLCLNNSHC